MTKERKMALEAALLEQQVVEAALRNLKEVECNGGRLLGWTGPGLLPPEQVVPGPRPESEMLIEYREEVAGLVFASVSPGSATWEALVREEESESDGE